MLVPALGVLLAATVSPVPTITLDEVVVTARRREQRLIEVAAGISRVTPGITGALELAHPAESLNRLPGVVLQRGSGQESLLAVRSPVLTGSGACGAFLILEDGFALRPTGFCNINQLFEVNTTQAAAIEVLRGPGSAVYAANAVHGVINILTPQVADLAGIRVTASSGSDDFRSVTLTVGADDYAAQALVRHDGGFRDDSASTDYKLNLLHDREFRDGRLRLRAAATRLDQDTAGFIHGFEAYRDPLLRGSNPNPEAFRDAQSLRLSAAWSRATCNHCSDEVRVIVRNSSMIFMQHFLLGKPLERNAQRSAAIALARSRPFADHALSWRLALDVEWADTTLLEIQDGPTLEGSAAARAIRPAGRHYDYSVAVATAGASAGLEQDLGDWLWRLSMRADRTDYRYNNRMRGGNTAEDGTPCPGGCLYSRPADRLDHYSRLTPRAELVKHLSEAQHLYAVLAEGFRPPEITELYRLQRNQSVAELGAERLRSAELGWRFAMGDKSALTGSVALYRARKTGVILRDTNGFNVSGGRTRHEGLECELDWQAHPRLRVRANGTWARHRYDFTRLIEGGESIVAGRDIDTAPRSIHRLALEVRPHDALAIEFEARRTGDYFPDAVNERRHPAQVALRLNTRWQLGDALGLNLEIENPTDQRLADRADYAQGGWRYFPARGRSIYFGVDWRRR